MSRFASDQLSEAVAHVQALGPRPEIGVVLGSGLGAFADRLSQPVRVGFESIPHLPRPAVSGHGKDFVLGKLGQVDLACLQGRVHLYEGHSPERVVFGVRLLAALGCRAVLLTNAAGGIKPELRPGDLMLIVDHLNLMGQNPLAGPDDGQGPRFPDLTDAYDSGLREAAHLAAREAQVALCEGVYAAMLGPSYETPAEIRMLEALGADAVGMSTVPEVIALRHRGVRVGAMSLITNAAAGVSELPLDHSEVQRVARQARDRFERVLAGWVQQLHSELGG